MKMVASLFASLLILISGDQARAQSCDSASKVTADIWDEVDAFVKAYPCSNVADCAVKQGALMTDKLTRFWNGMVGNSWARIGPRRLPFGETLTGTLVGTGGRMFVSFPAAQTPITVTIEETHGEGKASVVICKVNDRNKRTKVATKWFNDTKDRRRDGRERRSVSVKGAKGDIITIHLDGKSATKKFGYTIRTSE